MTWHVVWSQNAENDLAAIWLDDSDRNRIERVANHIDMLLGRDPKHEGESRENDRRVLLVPPLGVRFRGSADQRLVLVLHAWQFNTRR